MGKINILPFAVANLIAAGEVVDRPASVIKELMENSIDAGATRITVEIQNGGVTFMRVSDNGCGMEPDELPVALHRHATSKIKCAEDLDGILTLGFRGEALAAIASVSDIRIISKTADAAYGAVLEAHGGEVVDVREQGCSTGTSVIVENLFANVPARRKFLKKDVTESMAVTANVEKVALSHPEIAFRLIVDGNTRLETAGDGNLKNTVYAVFGKEFASRLLEVESEQDGIAVKGFIGRSDNYKSNRNHQNFFINGRYVKSKTAMAALEQAYTSYMPPEKFPTCVLFLSINPSRVDVNVHPAKLEVKFSNEKPVFEAIYYTVRTALENNQTRPSMQLDIGSRRRSGFTGRMSDATLPVTEGSRGGAENLRVTDAPANASNEPPLRMSAQEYRERYASSMPKKGYGTTVKPEPRPPRVIPEERTMEVGTRGNLPTVRELPPTEQNRIPTLPNEEIARGALPKNHEPKIPIPTPAANPPEPPKNEEHREWVSDPVSPKQTLPQETPTPTENAPEVPFYRIVGEVFYSYVIVECGEKMLLIDKHAAHERILFEELKRNLQKTEVVSQMLMLPVEVMLTAAEVEALRQYEGELDKIGFALRFARNTVSADAIPETVDPTAVADMLGSMAARILNATGDVKLTRDIIFEKALYQAACKAAIKAGRAYGDAHIKWLVDELMRIPDITFCPHGRPVALELSHHALDKQFDRTGF